MCVEEQLFLGGSNYTTVCARCKEAVFSHVKCYRRGIVLSNDNVTGETMPADDKMTIDERRKYLHQMQKRYRGADRQIREQLLDEMEHVAELHRKSLIRLMAGDLERKPRTQQRGRTYGLPVTRAVQVIAESLDYPCAERLTPNLVWMANHLAAQGELQVTPEVLAQLGEMSLSTVQRLSVDWLRDLPRRLPRGGPERANQVLRE